MVLDMASEQRSGCYLLFQWDMDNVRSRQRSLKGLLLKEPSERLMGGQGGWCEGLG